MFGRATYEQSASYWNSADLCDDAIDAAETEFARIFGRTTKVVFSRTHQEVPDGTILIKEELANRVLRVKG